jgi:hypothetical protein
MLVYHIVSCVKVSIGSGAQSCEVFADGISIGTGMSGTTNILMEERSKEVRVVCTNGSNAETTQKSATCRLNPDWNQF